MPSPCTKRFLVAFSGVLFIAVMGAACERSEIPTSVEPLHSTELDAVAQSAHVILPARADREFYLARIEPAEGSRATGIAQFEIVGDWFTAKVRVAGVAPGERIPQHIHLNPTCDAPGGALINLDENLSVGGEGPIAGDAYPIANRGGVVQYEARRPLAELEAALQEHHGIGIAELDLDQRNVNFHEPLPQPIPSVGCGEIARIN